MQEYDILIYYNYLLSTNKWKSIYDFLAELCVDVYVDITKYYNHYDSHPVLSLLASKIINKIDINARQSVNSSNRKNYKDFFLNVLKIDVAHSFIVDFSKYFIVISRITESGEIIYDPQWMKIFTSPIGVPMLSNAKDKEDSLKAAINKTSDKPNFAGVSSNATKAKNAQSDFRIKCQKAAYIPETIQEKNLEEFWKELTKDNFDFIYIWRNKISKTQYEELKSRITNCPQAQLSKFPQNYPNILVSYIAEWYKREYTGNEKENPLKALKLEQSVEKIWNNSNLPDYLLYTKKNRMYLDSLYVLGGLPINYLVKDKNTTTFKRIVDQISTGNSFVLSEGQDKKSIFTNYSIMKSLTTDNGSLKLFFDELLENSYPVHLEDQGIFPFSHFISSLKEWRPMHQKFFSEWLIEGNLTTEILRRHLCLILRPERDGLRHKSLSYDRLASWGIDTNIKSFSLCLSYNDEDIRNINKESEHITFINCHDNYFVAKYSSNKFIFSDIPTYYIHKVTLVAFYNYGTRKKICSLDVNPFQQFYETSYYNLLSSTKREGKTYVLLPFETKLKEKEYLSANQKFFEGGDSPYKLVEIKDAITILSDSNEHIKLYSKECGIKVVTTLYNDTILYEDNGCVLHRYLNNSREKCETYIPIFSKKSDLHIIKYEREFDPIELSLDDVCIEFKQGQSKEYKEWNDREEPIQGTVNIRVKAFGVNQVLVLYYIPGKEFPIKRNVNDTTILINRNLPLYRVPSNLKQIEQTPFSVVYRDSPKTYYDEDVNILWIGEEKDYVVLPVIRPFNVVDLLLDDVIAKSISLNGSAKINLEIPFILKDHFSVRKISDQGVFFSSLKDLKTDRGKSLSYLDFEFKDEVGQMLKTFKVKSDVGELDFYLCTQRLCTLNNTFPISDNASNYRFYYWTMNLEDEPVQLELNINKGILQLCLDDSQRTSGIIFQSLEDNLLPLTYFEPIVKGKWPVLTDDLSLLSLKCVEIAIKHRIPFRIFEPVYYLLQDTDSRLVDLAVDYLRKPCNENNDIFKYEGLYRLSHELYFSWLFLNRRTWIEMSIRLFNRLQSIKGVGKLTTEKKLELKSKLLISVKRLFNYCPNVTGYENKCSLRLFTEMCWNGLYLKADPSRDEDHVRTLNKSDRVYSLVNLGNPQWIGYTEDGSEFMSKGEAIAQNALRFMAPVPLSRRTKSKVAIKGFTVMEYQPFYRNQVRTERDLKQITEFLLALQNTPNAFVVIEQFFRKYLCRFN